MVSASRLAIDEIRLIKGMLKIKPRLHFQEILAYFTWPTRDINHRLISEIASGKKWAAIAAASQRATQTFMADAERLGMPAIAASSAQTQTHNDQGSAPMPPSLFLNWWPVGQGLFSSGTITQHGRAPLTWVYDCGTTSKQKHLNRALAAFGKQQARLGANSIRLLVISHFDKDHISGMVRLLGLRRVETLLLPYVPLWRRLVIAIDQNIGAADPALGFFVDPVGFLRGIDGGADVEIVFVPATGPDDEAPALPDDPDGDPDRLSPELDLKIETGARSDGAGENIGAHSSNVHHLRRGGRIVFPLLWEFVPYNDADLAPRATPAFLAAVAPLIETFKNDPVNREQALKDLKALYPKHFGRSSKDKNLISLFLYSGPVGSRTCLRPHLASHELKSSALTTRFSQMHTGDGTLDAGARFDRFSKYYSAAGRLDRAGIFQVMHHGASGNSHKGIAAKLNPVASLFSSDPRHRGFGHPHAEVLRDFWTFSPVQVDQKTGFKLFGALRRKKP